jgi:hypothetical protein
MEETKVTTEELEAARDVEAYAWGSLDVSAEDALSRMLDLTPEGRSRVQAVGARSEPQNMPLTSPFFPPQIHAIHQRPRRIEFPEVHIQHPA